jgi:hypothetical protein
MTAKLYRLPNQRWAKLRVVAAALAGVLLLPFVLVALLPMLIMFVPIAVIAIPLIAPVMLSGIFAARWEHTRRVSSSAAAAAAIKRTPVAVR